MKKKKAFEELVYMYKEILELKEELADAIEAKDDDKEIEGLTRQLRGTRSKYTGMIDMFSLFTGDHQNDVRRTIKEIVS